VLPHYVVKAINDKLHGNAVTYLRCGGIVNNHIMKGLLLSLSVKKMKSVNIWQSCKQEGGFLMHLCAWPYTAKKMKNSPDILSMVRNNCCDTTFNIAWIMSKLV